MRKIAALIFLLALVCPYPTIAQEDIGEHKVETTIGGRNPTMDFPQVADDAKPAMGATVAPTLPKRDLPMVADDELDMPKPFKPVITPEVPGIAPQDDQRPASGTRRVPELPGVELPTVPDDQMDEPKPFQPVQTPNMQTAGDIQNQRGEFIFDGAWLPDADPSTIGGKNYKTLQNLRYREGPAGLEGIRGYSKINTTQLSKQLKIRSGIQLLSSFPDTSYVVVQAENTGETVSHVMRNKTAIPDQGDFVEKELHIISNAISDPQGNETGSANGWSADPTGGQVTSTTSDPSAGSYHFEITDTTDAVDEGAMSDATTLTTTTNTIYNCHFDVQVTAGSWTIDIRDSADSATIATLETSMDSTAYASWTTKTYEWTSSGANERMRITTDVASNAAILIDNFSCYEKPLHIDGTGAGLGRFSPAPDGNIAYANGVESMIWGGDEARNAGVFVVEKVNVAASQANDLTFTAGPPGTITTGGNVDWTTIGFKPGHHATITDATDADNIKDITIENVTSTVLTVSETLAAGGAGAYTMAAEVVIPRKNVLDYTDGMNNSLTTSGNVMTVGGGADATTKLLLHMNGTHGSTTFTDTGATVHSVTANGDAKLTTADKKFGSASGEFDGTGDYLSLSDSDDWDFDSGEFTIDFWYNTDDVSYGLGVHDGVWEIQTDDSNYIEMYRSGNTLLFSMRNAGTSEVYMGATGLVADTWHHVALIRGWGGDSNDWALCLDGVQLGLDPNENHDVGNYTGDFNIGLTNDGIINGGAAAYMNGTIDEFRVVKGRALWTANFTPPTREYEDYSANAVTIWYTLSTRPLKGLEYTLSSANDTTSTSSVKVWNGSSFQTITLTNDGTSSGGISLAQDGEMLFPTTVGTARPLYFDGLYLYAYLSELSAGSAEIAQITVNAPFQPIVDIWDGINRQPITFQFWDDSDDYYEDFTLEVNFDSDSANSYGAEIGEMTTSDHIIVMFEDRAAAIKFVMVPTKVNTNASLPTVEYWSGTAWVSGGKVYDTTISNETAWETMGQTGVWAWEAPDSGEEQPREMFGQTGYVYRLKVDGNFPGGAATDVIVDRVYGVTAPVDIPGFTFPVMYGDMLFLCNNSAAGQENRCDYSLPHAPDVWNGDLTSMGGLQSLYFGGGEPLTAGAQIFNRYGSNVITALLMLKDNETYLLTGHSPATFQIYSISKNIGCPAPQTLVTAEVGFEVVEGAKRNVAIWMDYSGPVIFDGSVLHPVRGIDKYFDPTESDCIDYDNIEIAHGFYDPLQKEYNLLIPSGASQTTVNKWFALDISTLRWYEKVPATYPQASIQVVDTNGAGYAYAGLDTGYLMRLDNGNDWDGSAMTVTVETGDFYPSGSMWDQTRVRRVKIAAADITESGDDLSITHYADTATSGTALTALDLDSGTNRVVRSTQATNLLGWSHRLKFSASTNSTGPDMKLFGWGYLFQIEREDL